MSYDTDRIQYIAGLRELADRLDKHDDLPIPTHGDINWLLFSLGTKGDAVLAAEKVRAAQVVRRLGGADKDARDSDDQLFRFTRYLGGDRGLKLQVVVDRPAVCERVVTAVHEVTKKVPDPSAPLVEITETVEDVEWRCLPLLADAEVQQP